MTGKMRCIAVDDESLARKLLEENISQIPFLELVATCKNAFEAMEILEKEKIDLMFLDIQMPGMLGTQFLESLVTKPLVIFITAYDQYAVESYNLQVVDYLMKPVGLDRFTKAVLKAREVHNLLQAKKDDPEINYMFVNVEY